MHAVMPRPPLVAIDPLPSACQGMEGTSGTHGHHGARGGADRGQANVNHQKVAIPLT